MSNNQNLNQNLLNTQTYKSLTLLIKLAMNCGFSAFYYGYCLTFFNSINFNIIIDIFRLEGYPRALTQGLLTGSTCFTAALGTILSLQLISRFSRRECLMILSGCTIFLSILALIPSIFTLAFVRLSQGLIIGCISCLTPLYMRQMMPKQVSGPLWSLHQVFFVVGTSFGFVLVYVLTIFIDVRQSWRIIFGFPIVTSAIQLVNFQYFFRVDTPKWNILHNRKDQARQTLQFIYKPEYVEKILQQVIDANNYAIGKHHQDGNSQKSRFSQISEIMEAQAQLDHLEVGDKLRDKRQTQMAQIKKNQDGEIKVENTTNKLTNNSLAVFAAFFLIGQQQWLGSVVVMQYSGQMTLKTFPSLEQTIPAFIQMFGLCGSIFSVQAMRRWGRRQILLGGVFASILGLLTCYFIFRGFDFDDPQGNSLVLRLIVLVCFIELRLSMSIAMGPVPWLYIAQIIQPNLVPYCFLLNWFMLGLISTIFPILCEIQGGSPALAFLIFGVIGFVSFWIDKKVLIQTKNKSELEIRRQYDQKCR